MIWKSPLIPADPIVWRKDLDPAAKEKLTTFFVNYGTDKSADAATETAVLKALGWAPFRKSTNAQLLPIRIMEAEKAIGLIRTDTTITEADKTKQIEALQAKKKSFEDEMAKAVQG